MSDQFSIELDTQWQLAQYKKMSQDSQDYPDLRDLDWIDADVPGAVHYDLMRAGKLNNPFASSQAAHDAVWVAQSDWLYRNRFSLADTNINTSRVIIKIHGIDTFADIWLNGEFLGETGNAFRVYQFEVQHGALKTDDNLLLVHIKGHDRMIVSKIPEAKRMGRTGEVSGLLGKSLIRRYQRNFFTNSSLLNLGTGVLGIGIYKPIGVQVFPGAFIEDCAFTVASLSEQEATASVCVELNPGRFEHANLTIEAVLWETDRNQPVAVNSVTTTANSVELPLTIPQPKLWWPAGYGEPNLYHLAVHVSDGTFRLHTHEQRVGLKQVELMTRQANGRKTFFFKVNGQKVYARGFTTIPPDYLKVHDSWDAYARLFTIMKNAQTNMSRIWGGGVVENEQYYDTCDELGIMVWHDFLLHSNVYPDYDADFVENFRQEAIGLVKRLRNHACLTALCGGNEQQEGWDEWNWKSEMDAFYGEKLIKELLPDIAAAYCPAIP